MKRLNKPNIDFSELFDKCISEIVDIELLKRLENARSKVIVSFQKYENLASNHQLYKTQASKWGKDEQLVLANIKKVEFVDLYSKGMLGRGKSGRSYYDRLIMSAPNGKCPFCGFGHVSTLDHFLAKAYYPVFGILPSNLIPACADCNKGKGSSVVKQNEQVLHPYFESSMIDTDPWLFAEIIQTAPVTSRYFCRPPDSWPADLTLRASNHFREFKLAHRFAIETATELGPLASYLCDLTTYDLRKEHLLRLAGSERRTQVNTWKAALYEALAASEWYLQEGYLIST